nr:hypothetical protein [uncultured Arsenicibacter sp.]
MKKAVFSAFPETHKKPVKTGETDAESMRYSTQLKDYQVNNTACASAGGRKMPYLRSAGWQGTVITTGFLLFRLPVLITAGNSCRCSG